LCRPDAGTKIPRVPSSTVLKLSAESLAALRKSWIFSGVGEAELLSIQPWLRENKIPRGAVLIRRGELNPGLFIVTKGRFEVVDFDAQGNTEVITRVGPGETLGEISALTGEPTTATVRALEDSVVCAIAHERLPELAVKIPGLIWGLARLLASRVVRTTARLTREIREGMRGQLEAIPPAPLVQAICVSDAVGTLTVERGNRRFSLYVEGTRVGALQLGNVEGPEAFYEFLSWKSGHFRFEPGKRDGIGAFADAMALLLEGHRRLDEGTRARPSP
jgi:CRP-like cAMP-binding protein